MASEERDGELGEQSTKTNSTRVKYVSWDEFRAELKDLQSAIRLSGHASPLLFRGQADAEWSLETTLERADEISIEMVEYHRWANTVKPAIESVTGVSWNVPVYSAKLDAHLRKYDSIHLYPSSAMYEYMIYLRHHGFPSPLLDWSRSPYVAAFFAFRSPGKAERAIYAFCETPKGSKARASGAPYVTEKGPYVRGPKRHFLQQSTYTICAVFGDRWRFASHEDVFSLNNSEQDLLLKFVVKAEERTHILRLLDEHNLNAFSLFGTDDSLMETLWFREISRKREEPPRTA